ncbi:MAG: hypothetical protein LCH39_01190 [Proteobacteria bacterium]|nr:hypothetical protein [Pseudomonadota bacterium]
MLKPILVFASASFWLVAAVHPAQAQRQQYCERTNYSAQEITNAVNASPLRDELKATSCSLGGLGRFESGGNTGVYNGSCCTGIFQLNNSNVRNYAGVDRQTFGCMSLQQQVDAWARLTNDGYNTGVVRHLTEMGTFDGQRVDASFIAACIQLGTGNCQTMVNSGRCSGFADSNGTTICDMARAAQSNADPNCQNNPNAQACDLGPGDFGGTGPVAAQPPAPSAADIRVGVGQV